jgi:hypothetical protein
MYRGLKLLIGKNGGKETRGPTNIFPIAIKQRGENRAIRLPRRKKRDTDWMRRRRGRGFKRISTLATEEEQERRRSGSQLIWTDVVLILAGSSKYILT